jgi:replicative DNA helicase
MTTPHATPLEKPVPYSIEAEEATLGALLMDPDMIPVIRGLLRPGDFYREKHAWIYETLLTMTDRGMEVDTLTVCDVMGDRRLEEIGGPAALTELFMRVPSAVFAEHYARIVQRHSVRRQTIGAAEKIARAALSDDVTQEELVAITWEAAGAIGQQALLREPQAFSAVAARAADRFERRYTKSEPPGLPVFSHDLTRTLGSLRRGDLFIIAARPGMGKTSLALAMMEHVARAGYRALMFSLEMNSEDLMDRLVASYARIDGTKIRDGDCSEDEFEQAIAAYSDLAQLPIHVEDASGITHEYARATIARHMGKYPDLRLVVVDYVQIMAEAERARSQQRYEQIGQVSRQLKAAARQYGLCILLLAQVGRQVESRADKRPGLADLRESGDLEADADEVAFIYRDAVYNPDAPDHVAEVLIAKHRNGPTGMAELFFDRSTGRWGDMAHWIDEANEPPPPPQRSKPQAPARASSNAYHSNGNGAYAAQRNGTAGAVMATDEEIFF